MNVSELKEKLEILEAQNLGDVEIYFSPGVDWRGNEDVHTIEDVYIDQHFPVIILDGYSMEGEEEFLSNLDIDNRKEVR